MKVGTLTKFRAGFAAYFAEHYKGCFKTSWHFFIYVVGATDERALIKVSRLSKKFNEYCAANGIKRGWESASKWWYVEIYQGLKK